MSTPSATSGGGRTGSDADLITLLSALGHEMRTPLTVVKGRLALMQRHLSHEDGREDDVRALGRVMHPVERLAHQIEIVLDAAHLRENRFTLTLVETDLAAVIERAIARHQGGEPRMPIAFEPPTPALVGLWDPAPLGHALGALLANASKYSKPERAVWVRAYGDGAWARVEIEDEGIGVPEADRATIFEFGQHASNTETFCGAGLGLYVAREIVQRHGGAIGVEPRSEGGSVFWFTLPL